MRKDKNSFMFYMPDTERKFIDEMAYRRKLKVKQYLVALIREEMRKNPEVVESVMEAENEKS